MRMVTLKKGKSEMKPEKGQKVGCYYKGHLDGPDGKIFDQLQVIFFAINFKTFELSQKLVAVNHFHSKLELGVSSVAGTRPL